MRAIDLHVHSTFSDGTLTPTQLVELAEKCNLEAFALTDHDTTDGIEEAVNAASSFNLEVIPGIEFSTEYRGKDIHILGYYINPYNEEFQNAITEFRNSRETRNKKMCAKLNDMGIKIDYDEFIKSYPDSVITRAHYAKYMLAHGMVKNMEEAFEKYIGDDCPGFVPREKITPSKAVSLILKCHGIPVLAHPILYKYSDADLEKLVAELKRAGLKGIETIYSTYSNSDEKLIRKLASKYRLLITGGSDFHGNNKPNLSLGYGRGDLYIPAKLLPPLKSAYLKGFVPNKNVRQAMFFDMDGTLLNDEKEISTITRALLFKACENGHIFVINTGRALASVNKVIDRLAIRDICKYVCAFNGGAIYDVEKDEIVDRVTLDTETARGVNDIAKMTGCHIQSYTDYELISEKDNEELRYYSSYVYIEPTIVDDIVSYSPNPYKLLLMNFKDHDALLEAQRLILEKYSDKVFCLFSCDKFLEVIPIKGGKGYALKSVLSLTGIKHSNSYAFADEENDLTLLEAAGKSVCMINGNPKLKAIADYITFRDNNNDGLADFLELFS